MLALVSNVSIFVPLPSDGSCFVQLTGEPLHERSRRRARSSAAKRGATDEPVDAPQSKRRKVEYVVRTALSLTT